MRNFLLIFAFVVSTVTMSSFSSFAAADLATTDQVAGQQIPANQLSEQQACPSATNPNDAIDDSTDLENALFPRPEHCMRECHERFEGCMAECREGGPFRSHHHCMERCERHFHRCKHFCFERD
jgi:hypothetical protein